jgi:hypothetical protein
VSRSSLRAVAYTLGTLGVASVAWGLSVFAGWYRETGRHMDAVEAIVDADRAWLRDYPVPAADGGADSLEDWERRRRIHHESRRREPLPRLPAYPRWKTLAPALLGAVLMAGALLVHARSRRAPGANRSPP